MDICFILCHASICTCLDLGSWSEKTTIFELGCTVSKIPNVAINWRIIVNKSNLLLWSIVLYGVISRKCIVIRLARALFLRHTAVYTIVCPQLRLPELYIRRCLCVCHSMCMHSCVCVCVRGEYCISAYSTWLFVINNFAYWFSLLWIVWLYCTPSWCNTYLRFRSGRYWLIGCRVYRCFPGRRIEGCALWLEHSSHFLSKITIF